MFDYKITVFSGTAVFLKFFKNIFVSLLEYDVAKIHNKGDKTICWFKFKITILKKLFKFKTNWKECDIDSLYSTIYKQMLIVEIWHLLWHDIYFVIQHSSYWTCHSLPSAKQET